jgi:hypothetical protein
LHDFAEEQRAETLATSQAPKTSIHAIDSLRVRAEN